MQNTQKTTIKLHGEKSSDKLCVYHSKDLDGWFSGAVVKHKYHNIDLMGWDYSDPIPEMDIFEPYSEVIFIDVTLPFNYLLSLSSRVKLTVIDHHITFKNQVDDYVTSDRSHDGEFLKVNSIKPLPFEFIYDSKLSACEIGFQHYFGYIPPIVKLVGEYDTWRSQGTPEWSNEILPMKYFLYGCVSSPDDVNPNWLDITPTNYFGEMLSCKSDMIEKGSVVKNYVETQNKSKTEFYSFERECYGYRVLCLNTNFFSSDTMSSRFDPEKHDLMMGFSFNGEQWGVSLRSIEGGVNVSEIARQRGGGGHVCAAGFEAKNFEDIFK